MGIRWHPDTFADHLLKLSQLVLDGPSGQSRVGRALVGGLAVSDPLVFVIEPTLAPLFGWAEKHLRRWLDQLEWVTASPSPEDIRTSFGIELIVRARLFHTKPEYGEITETPCRDSQKAAPERDPAAILTEAGDEEEIAFLQFRDFLTLLETPARERETYREIHQRFDVGSATRIVRLLAVHDRRPIATEQT
jgi:hypothetical protein